MNYLGKIFVFAVFIMSLVLMTFAGIVFLRHTDWRDEIERPPEAVRTGKPLGYRYRLEQAETEKQKLEQEINQLVKKIAESEKARDEVVAKLQSALAEKSTELDGLRKEKIDRDAAHEKALAKLEDAQTALEKATTMVNQLRSDIRDQQKKVDERVETAAKLSVALEETKALLAVADERRGQLEKQVANARILLKQSGLNPDSPPKDMVPTLNGKVTAVTGDWIELSLGGDDGLQVGHVVEVFRAGEYVGRAKIRLVKPDRAVADLVKELTRGVVQRGDNFTTRLEG